MQVKVLRIRKIAEPGESNAKNQTLENRMEFINKLRKLYMNGAVI